jgi:hypothetical protein
MMTRPVQQVNHHQQHHQHHGQQHHSPVRVKSGYAIQSGSSTGVQSSNSSPAIIIIRAPNHPKNGSLASPKIRSHQQKQQQQQQQKQVMHPPQHHQRGKSVDPTSASQQFLKPPSFPR